jgi:hypothetical protein
MSSAASTAHTSQSTSRKDPAWEHALPLTGKETKNQVGCKYCKNYFNGGITRFKKHLAGIKGQSISCTQVPEDVREKIKAMLDAYDAKCDLVRAGTTRIATSYLNLRSLYDKRNELKQLFASQEWDKSSWSKKITGQNAHDLVLDNKFWSQMLEVINYFEPLAYVLRRVDGDVPAMGYIYGDLLKAKQDIATRLNGNQKKIWSYLENHR